MRSVCAALVVFSVLSVGCTASSTGRAASHKTLKIDPDLPPIENLRRLAAAELHADQALPTADCPPPPGMQASLIRERDADDPIAWLTLVEALQHVSAAHEVILPRVEPADASPDSPEVARHYIRGREAALNNDHRTAVSELERARAIEPQNPSVLRALGRAYLALPNQFRAQEMFDLLVALDPDDGEAVLEAARIRLRLRQFQPAAALLAPRILQGRLFEHDPEADFIVMFTVADALQSMGYDRAAVESATQVVTRAAPPTQPTIYFAQRQMIFYRRSEVWRNVGDALCRLGEYDQAVQAYTNALGGAAEPQRLAPRLVYANLRLERTHHAQLALVDAIDRDEIRDRELTVRLCAYLAEHSDPVDLLAAAIQRRLDRDPDNVEMARAVAALRPSGEAAEVLRTFIDRHPDDFEALSQLLRWLAERDIDAAIALTESLAETHPTFAGDYVERLVLASPRPAKLIAKTRNHLDSPGGALVCGRLHAYLGGAGPAWRVCQTARRRWPDDLGLLLLQIDLAAALEESGLLSDIVESAGHPDEPSVWVARARASRTVHDYESALEAARRAVELDAGDAQALIELGLAHLGSAVTAENEVTRIAQAQAVEAAAELALSLDPNLDEAFDVLWTLYNRRELLFDTQKRAELYIRLNRITDGPSIFAARLDATRALRSRSKSAMEGELNGLLDLYDRDPTEIQLLKLAVTVWMKLDQIDEAERWLEARLQARPGDPWVLQQWVLLAIEQEDYQRAIDRLESVLAAEQYNHTASQLLESVYRAAGRHDALVKLVEQRLLTQPATTLRDVRLAAAFAEAQRTDRAMAHLEQVLSHRDSAPRETLLQAMQVASTMEQAALLTAEFFDAIALDHPNLPLAQYGLAMLALAQADRLDDRFDALVRRAIEHSSDGRGPGVNAALQWIDLAQTLVNADQPQAAARALRNRVVALAPLEPAAMDALFRATLVADAAAGEGQATLELIRAMVVGGRLPVNVNIGRQEFLHAAVYEASNLHALIGDLAGTELLLREVIRLDPENEMAMNNLGYTRIEEGHSDAETVRWIERAHELDLGDPNILDTIGWLRYLQGRFSEPDSEDGAVQFIESALDETAGEDSAEVWDHLGDALWRVGDFDRAVTAWRRVVSDLDDQHRDRLERLFLQRQLELGLLVVDPAELYDRDFGPVLERARAKIEAVRSERQPAVAPTFAELETTAIRPAGD